MSKRPRPLIGLAAGIAAGLVASAAMVAFQSIASDVLDQDSEEDPPAVKAADKVSEAVAVTAVPEPYREASGQLVHYVVGAVMGGIYGVLTEYRPEASAGFGSAYGVATAALLDEAAVPAFGLGPDASESPPETHVYGIASHLIFGVVLEGVRWLIAGRR